MPIEVKILLLCVVSLLGILLGYRAWRRRTSRPVAPSDPVPDVPVGQYFHGQEAVEKYGQYGHEGNTVFLMVFQTRGRPNEGTVLPVTPIANLPGGEMPFTLQQTLRLAWYVRLLNPTGTNDRKALQKIAYEANNVLKKLKMPLIERDDHLGGLPLEYKKRVNLVCACFGKEDACALFCDGLHPLLKKMVRDYIFPPPAPQADETSGLEVDDGGELKKKRR